VTRLGGLCICLGFMDRAMGMLGWCIDGVQFQGPVACIDEIMPFSGRYDKSIVLTDSSPEIQIIPTVTHHDHTLAFFYAYKLIKIGMYLQAYVFSDIEAHQG